MRHRIVGADAPFDIVWDSLGVAHVYAQTVADAYRGMGYAAGSERLWQIHLSCAFANGEAAALLGERWVRQDALQRACNVHGDYTEVPASDGDWVVDAYLEGLNSWVQGLAKVPAEFIHADAEPRIFTRADVAARYRFTSWFQHKSFTEKMLLGRLMATHGVDYFRNHVLHFSDTDAELVDELKPYLQELDLTAVQLGYPEINANSEARAALATLSGSNNWAVRGGLSESGKPMLATDPHQPHSIPNTFFYVHLHAPDWDAFGAAFPGVPYFMMGYTRDVAWGLTTGFVDSYDVYIEKLRKRPTSTQATNSSRVNEYLSADGWRTLRRRTESIAVKGADNKEIEVTHTEHGVLLESLQQQLGLGQKADAQAKTEVQTALHWTLEKVPTSAGALARLPLAKSTEEFGELLFENDVCPLVNNIICVDGQDNLQRFIAATLPARKGATGSVPLAGWRADCDFPRSKADDLHVEINPERGYSLTANNDTMGERGPYYIHNFPVSSARADRIDELLRAKGSFTVADFTAMQLDLKDLRALELMPQLLQQLEDSDAPELVTARELLLSWDGYATTDSAAACVYYRFLDEFWQRDFLFEVLGDPVVKLLPLGAPGINRLDIAHFYTAGSPWLQHKAELRKAVQTAFTRAMQSLIGVLGSDYPRWRLGDLQKVAFQHSLGKHAHWQHMRVGSDPLGGSATTLAMAMHIADPELDAPGKSLLAESNRASDVPPWRVYHGPAFRLVVDLADPDHAQFVIAGGNGGLPQSPFATNQYPAWQLGNYYTLNLRRDELDVVSHWSCES